MDKQIVYLNKEWVKVIVNKKGKPSKMFGCFNMKNWRFIKQSLHTLCDFDTAPLWRLKNALGAEEKQKTIIPYNFQWSYVHLVPAEKKFYLMIIM